MDIVCRRVERDMINMTSMRKLTSTKNIGGDEGFTIGHKINWLILSCFEGKLAFCYLHTLLV